MERGTQNSGRTFFRVFVNRALRRMILPHNKHQPNSATTGRICKIPRSALRLQTELESAHCQAKETN